MTDTPKIFRLTSKTVYPFTGNVAELQVLCSTASTKRSAILTLSAESVLAGFSSLSDVFRVVIPRALPLNLELSKIIGVGIGKLESN